MEGLRDAVDLIYLVLELSLFEISMQPTLTFYVTIKFFNFKGSLTGNLSELKKPLAAGVESVTIKFRGSRCASSSAFLFLSPKLTLDLSFFFAIVRKMFNGKSEMHEIRTV